MSIDHLLPAETATLDPTLDRQIHFCCAQLARSLYNQYYIRGRSDMQTLKITTVGASSGVILTKEIMAHLKVKKGDTLYLTEAADGGYRLTPYNPDFARQMERADEIMHDDREVLRALAK